MKMTYIDEITHYSEIVNVPDDLYSITEDLYNEKGQGAISLREDKKSLYFLMNESTNYYRVTIEKVEWS